MPPLTPPAPAPVLFVARHGFTWRGSTGANHYATGLQDAIVTRAKELEENGDPAPLALWCDESAPGGSTFYYRVRGFNAAGAADFSPVLAVTRP